MTCALVVFQVHLRLPFSHMIIVTFMVLIFSVLGKVLGHVPAFFSSASHYFLSDLIRNVLSIPLRVIVEVHFQGRKVQGCRFNFYFLWGKLVKFSVLFRFHLFLIVDETLDTFFSLLVRIGKSLEKDKNKTLLSQIQQILHNPKYKKSVFSQLRSDHWEMKIPRWMACLKKMACFKTDRSHSRVYCWNRRVR